MLDTLPTEILCKIFLKVDAEDIDYALWYVNTKIREVCRSKYFLMKYAEQVKVYIDRQMNHVFSYQTFSAEGEESLRYIIDNNTIKWDLDKLHIVFPQEIIFLTKNILLWNWEEIIGNVKGEYILENLDLPWNIEEIDPYRGARRKRNLIQNVHISTDQILQLCPDSDIFYDGYYWDEEGRKDLYVLKSKGRFFAIYHEWCIIWFNKKSYPYICTKTYDESHGPFKIFRDHNVKNPGKTSKYSDRYISWKSMINMEEIPYEENETEIR